MFSGLFLVIQLKIMNITTCFLLLLVLSSQCLIVCLAMRTKNHTTDQFALLRFKDQIVDPKNVLRNNWTSSSCVCKWVGVSCGVIHERVTALNLSNMDLKGTIPPHVGNLSLLHSLDLSNNHFYGHPPKELRQLHRLRIVQLSFNDFNGEIPSWLGNLRRVKMLLVRNNSFTGTIPQALVNMSNLETLDLGSNQLFGHIPSSIFKLSSLEEIILDNNELSGNIPLNIGEIPQEIGNLLNLETKNPI
ncbi:receptor-like protein 35 [Hibiscus syriacus]|uniref:receptor-like protein 35 n=1 Tax=Hibiscus syriacus TaxID=106335 RepID=UPI001921B8F3|nr:receptor-like protein 35 [Hibiscus syriacus]